MEIYMKKILRTICILVSLLCVVFSAVACGEKNEFTGWQTQAKQSGDSRLVYVAELSLGSTNVDVAEIWVNVSNLKVKSTIITLKLAKSTSSVKTLECPVAKSAIKESKDGWIQLYFDSAVTCKTVTVEVVDEMMINEICFVKKDGKLATVTFSKGGVKASTSGKLYTKAELDALTEGHIAYNENPAYNIVDEQSKFPIEKIQTKG